jgi:hypothetical protein
MGLTEETNYGKHVFVEALLAKEVQCCVACDKDELWERHDCPHCGKLHCDCTPEQPPDTIESCSTITAHHWHTWAVAQQEEIKSEEKCSNHDGSTKDMTTIHTESTSCSIFDDGPDLPTVAEIITAQRADPRLYRIIKKLLPHSKNGTSTTGWPTLLKGAKQEQLILRNHVHY